MIQDYPASERPVGRLIAQEALAYAASGLLFPLGMRDRPRPTPRRAEQRTVVLVHGYMANKASLMPLAAFLRLRGYKQLLLFNYASSNGVEAGARALKAFLKQNVRGGRIDLIGHSLGGLVSRVYLQHLGGARRVDRCITLGTPHQGTYNAYWVPTRVGRQLRPDSALLARLEATRSEAAAVRFTSVVAGSDPIVIPRVFSGHGAAAAASGSDEIVHVPDLGHLGMLFSPTVFRTVLSGLRAPVAPRTRVSDVAPPPDAAARRSPPRRAAP
jgi:triacylglycerol lipase